ncbi:MAG: hypothetical protein EP344_05585 [Bacteroidetes bacterium]|nr:MAG: hypothetical protein EP344_05585 [Bacteroidota bacterium]
MQKRLFILTVLLLALLAGCTEKSGILTFSLDTPFTIEQGATATWAEDAAIQIRFDGVTSDSRCPVDAECVWAGRAEIEVTFIQPGDTQTNRLILGDPTGTDYTSEALFGSFKVKLLEVKPEPRANHPIPQGDYVVKLQVLKE